MERRWQNNSLRVGTDPAVALTQASWHVHSHVDLLGGTSANPWAGASPALHESFSARVAHCIAAMSMSGIPHEELPILEALIRYVQPPNTLAFETNSRR